MTLSAPHREPAGRRLARLSLLWELPAGFLSWTLYRVVRLAVGMRLMVRAQRSEKASLLPWRVLSHELLARRGYLEQIVIGPRWNTAAINTAAGPFEVESRIELDRAALDRDAELWSLMVYAVPSLLAGPGVKLARHATSVTAPAGGSRLTLELAPGRYWISIRFYGWRGPLNLPRIWVDGRDTVSPVIAPADANDFYRDLHRRTNGFLTALQIHSFVLAKWQRILPRRIVERTLLPVGDPETEFHHGVLARGEALGIDAPAELLATHFVFYTAYNRASLPVVWLRIETPAAETPRAAEPCLYLVRVLRRVPAAGDAAGPGGAGGPRPAVRLAVIPAASRARRTELKRHPTVPAG